jgi:hypothetical protein
MQKYEKKMGTRQTIAIDFVFCSRISVAGYKQGSESPPASITIITVQTTAAVSFSTRPPFLCMGARAGAS